MPDVSQAQKAAEELKSRRDQLDFAQKQVSEVQNKLAAIESKLKSDCWHPLEHRETVERMEIVETRWSHGLSSDEVVYRDTFCTICTKRMSSVLAKPC